ncbi:hypothetical protein SCP_0604000 [Sparassis crispa]|uniref:Uncharacterized protein n=1 Tax=Sparassis crispa TaxID=139825 RepID=A0A401GQA9_9APHY|nr:hypothetical protein SCP_0604000 [Sparassis crispa]GBE84421.1 hypothetical protein SCP_0604000 [Sparassis crispa]
MDFVRHFQQVDHDLLRPSGSYVGVKSMPDDARMEKDSDDGDAPASSSEMIRDCPEDFGDEAEDLPEGLDIDDFFPDTVDDIEKGERSADTRESNYLLMDEKKYLKSSIISSLLTSNWS